MEKKKKIDLIFFIIFTILGILIIFAGYKVLNDHHKKEYLVVYNKIKEAARECYLKEDCQEKTTLKDLYDKNYLTKQVDPLTKEDMDINICLEYKNKNIEFCN